MLLFIDGSCKVISINAAPHEQRHLRLINLKKYLVHKFFFYKNYANMIILVICGTSSFGKRKTCLLYIIKIF